MFEIENLDELEKMVSEDVNSKIPEISDCLIRYSLDDSGKISLMDFLFYTSENQESNTDKILNIILDNFSKFPSSEGEISISFEKQ